MVYAELRHARLHDLHLELFRLLPSALGPVRLCQVGHTRQRVRMVHAELHLARLQMKSCLTSLTQKPAMQSGNLHSCI